MQIKNKELLQVYEIIYKNKHQSNIEIRHALCAANLKKHARDFYSKKKLLGVFVLYKNNIQNNLGKYIADYLSGMNQNDLFAKYNINKQIMDFVSKIHMTKEQMEVRRRMSQCYINRGSYYNPVIKEKKINNNIEPKQPIMMFEDDERLAELPKYKASIPIKVGGGLYGSAAGMCVDL